MPFCSSRVETRKKGVLCNESSATDKRKVEDDTNLGSVRLFPLAAICHAGPCAHVRINKTNGHETAKKPTKWYMNTIHCRRRRGVRSGIDRPIKSSKRRDLWSAVVGRSDNSDVAWFVWLRIRGLARRCLIESVNGQLSCRPRDSALLHPRVSIVHYNHYTHPHCLA